jgi:hypothetical protein
VAGGDRGALVSLLEGSQLPVPISSAEPAYAIVAGYLGLNLLSRLLPDLHQTERLFDLLTQLAPLAAAFSKPPPGE